MWLRANRRYGVSALKPVLHTTCCSRKGLRGECRPARNRTRRGRHPLSPSMWDIRQDIHRNWPVLVCQFQSSASDQPANTASPGMGNFRFIGKVHHDLSRKPFMMMDYSTVRAVPPPSPTTLVPEDTFLTAAYRQREVLAIQASCATNSHVLRST